MDIILLHNPGAGDGEAGKREIVTALEAKGHRVTYQSLKEKDYEEILDRRPADLLAVAGGDGTLGKVFRKLRGRPQRPVLVLPAGTANNIARHLGLAGGWENAIDRLGGLEPRPFRTGRVVGVENGGFFESVGIGLFAILLTAHKHDDERLRQIAGERGGFAGVRAALSKLAMETPALRLRVESDGKTVEETVIWMEIMNIGSIGPHIDFGGSPQAADDSGLRMVVVPEALRRELVAWFANAANGDFMPFPAVTWHSLGRRATVVWSSHSYHIDDELRHGDQAAGEKTIVVERDPEPLPILR